MRLCCQVTVCWWDYVTKLLFAGETLLPSYCLLVRLCYQVTVCWWNSVTKLLFAGETLLSSYCLLVRLCYQVTVCWWDSVTKLLFAWWDYVTKLLFAGETPLPSYCLLDELFWSEKRSQASVKARVKSAMASLRVTSYPAATVSPMGKQSTLCFQFCIVSLYWSQRGYRFQEA